MFFRSSPSAGGHVDSSAAPRGSVEPEAFAEIDTAHFGVRGELGGRASPENGAGVDDVAAVHDRERVTHVVVRDEDSDPGGREVPDHALDVEHGDRVDAGERLVEKHEAGRQRKSCLLYTS